MSNWARSAWNSRAPRRDNRDGLETTSPSRSIRSRNSVGPNRAQGSAAKEPQGARVLGWRHTRYCGSYLQLNWKEDSGTKGQPPQPMVQDNTDNNVQDLKNQLQAEQQKGEPQATVPNPDYAPGGRYFGCVPGQVCTPEMMQQNPQAQQLTPEQQQEQQLAAKDRELAYNARFASNIAYSRPLIHRQDRRSRSRRLPTSHQSGCGRP
jgi:hypothetical protein